MTCFFLQHREFENGRFVYITGGNSFELKSETPKNNDIPEVKEIEYDPSKTDHDAIWNDIDAAYGKTAYEALISDYTDTLMPNAPGDYKSVLIRKSSGRYMRFHKRIEKLFMKTSNNLDAKFKYAVDRITSKTESDLAVIRSAVEGVRDFVDFKDAMPDLENKAEVEDHFDYHLNALNSRYFNVDVNEGVVVPGIGIPILDPFINPDFEKTLDSQAYPEEKMPAVPILSPFIGSDFFKGKGEGGYDAMSENFQNKMETWVHDKLNWLLKKEGVTQADLETFKDQITKRYEQYSTFDKNSDIVSLADLGVLESAANPPLDAVGRILDGTNEKALQHLEIMHLMNRDAWDDMVEMAADIVIKGAVNSASEDLFIKEMSKYREVEDFGDAKSEFLDMLDDYSKVGPSETLAFIQSFNLGVHNEVIQHQMNIEPASLTMQVNKQMDYLLKGKGKGMLVPHRETDRMLVRFMTAGREGRNDILANDGTRSVLFQAIRQSTEQYPEIYDKQFSNIPDDVTKLKRSARIEKPTYHDRAAQMQALIILGKQSQSIVSKLNNAPEHRGKDYMNEISEAAIPEDIKVVKTGLRFESANPGNARFRSNLDRGGFNTRDLALKGVKVLGVLTVVANFAQSYSEAEGEDFVDKMANAVELTASNHAVWIGAAATVGAHMAERDPRLLKFPWLSQHGRAGLLTAYSLDDMGRRLSNHQEVARFTHNNAEWRALSEPSMDPSQIKEMMKEADERVDRGQKPFITNEDLGKVIKDKSILATLTKGGRSARVRYMFYKKFFTSAAKPDVNHLKELCTGSSYISSSPVEANS